MSERLCSCSEWPKRAAFPFFPIWFNPKINEHVVFGGTTTNTIIVYYCPTCGGRMRKPRLGKFFTMPSDEELAEARALLEKITDVAAMRSLLGEPDDICDWFKDEFDEPLRNPHGPDLKRQYTYKSRWKTLVVTIKEWEDGHLSFFIHGQWKDTANVSNDAA